MKRENISLGKYKCSLSIPSPCYPDLLTPGFGNEIQLLLVLLHNKWNSGGGREYSCFQLSPLHSPIIKFKCSDITWCVLEQKDLWIYCIIRLLWNYRRWLLPSLDNTYVTIIWEVKCIKIDNVNKRIENIIRRCIKLSWFKGYKTLKFMASVPWAHWDCNLGNPYKTWTGAIPPYSRQFLPISFPKWSAMKISGHVTFFSLTWVLVCWLQCRTC